MAPDPKGTGAFFVVKNEWRKMKVGAKVKISRIIEQEALRKTQENFNGIVTHVYDHPTEPKRRMLKVEKERFMKLNMQI